MRFEDKKRSAIEYIGYHLLKDGFNTDWFDFEDYISVTPIELSKHFNIRLFDCIIQIGCKETFDRWANSVDYSFDTDKLLTDGYFDEEKYKLFIEILKYLKDSGKLKPSKRWGKNENINYLFRNVKREINKKGYILELKNVKKRNLRKHLLDVLK